MPLSSTLTCAMMSVSMSRSRFTARRDSSAARSASTWMSVGRIGRPRLAASASGSSSARTTACATAVSISVAGTRKLVAVLAPAVVLVPLVAW
jgi:hypothetical protein